MQIVTSDLRFRYPAHERWALDGIDITIRSGEVTWLTGALGSGTSTLLLALAGLAPRLTGGELRGVVRSDDINPANLSPLRAGIAYLGPSPALQISGIARTVQDEIAVGPMNLGWPREEISAAVSHALGRLHIAQLADRAPGRLSGGETQRVLIASLLAARPGIWLLDEPFSALDRASTAHVRGLLRDMASNGATVIVACDDADTMVEMANRVIVLEHGRVSLDGSPAMILAGDEVLAAGAGTTDAAMVAAAAGWSAPRPLTREDLLKRIARDVAPERASAASAPAMARQPGTDLDMQAVSFSYPGGTPVLTGVSFTLGGGEAVGLFGANGAGKSTLLRLAMALEHPTIGRVTALGQGTAGKHPEDFAPRSGFLFQQPERQLFASTVQAECALAPRLAGWNEARIVDAVGAALDDLGLSDTARMHPYDLPLPRRRLVALAAILTADPQLLLLDEPTAALDTASRERVIRVVRDRAQRGRTILAVTHDPLFAHEALGRGLVLEHGRVVHDVGLRDIIDDRRLQRPAALAAAEWLGLPEGADRRRDVARRLGA